jgi:branched-chain amino acid transport system ATP-binding protein
MLGFKEVANKDGTEKQNPVKKATFGMDTDAATDGTCELRLDDIHAGYGKKEVLRGISLRARRGEIVAIVGPNGSGKSTLLKVVAGFLIPSDGRVLIKESDATTLAPHDRVKLGVTYFMQGGRVFPNLTVKENIEMGAITISPNENERVKNIEEVLEVFPNLRSLFGRRAGLLSGGERQALALSMLLVRRPRLLLLDEPSAGLSPKLVQDILGKVRELSSAWDTTVLLVEQNIHEALIICDRALALVNGGVALQTKQPKQWLTDGRLERLFLGNE